MTPASRSSSASPSTDAPSVREVAADVARRAVLPGIVVWVLVMGIGLLIRGPLGDLPAEESINRWFVAGRTATMDSVTTVWSTGADTWWTIGLAILYSIVVLALTRRWWVGILPVLAISLEASIFVLATNLIDRPRPDVVRLDPAPPTSSYPSGHTAAAFALYLTLFLVARRIRLTWVRVTVQIVCFVIPFLVAYARLYRGMHHLSDVIIGAILGIWCAWTTYTCIRANRESAQLDRVPR